MIGCPVALRASSRRNTASSRGPGTIFSTPMQAMCKGGSDVPRSALPSLVHTTTPPVAAMAKFTPVSPACAARNFSRRCCRAASVSAFGSAKPAGVPSLSWNSSPISPRLRWMAGCTMCEGGSLRSCTMRSPRSVSITSMPCASRKWFSPHSSVSIDLLFTSRVTPRSRNSAKTISLCSRASRAQCTRAPPASAFFSNCSR